MTVAPKPTLPDRWSSLAAFDRTRPQVADAALAAGLAVVIIPWTVLDTPGGAIRWLCGAGLVAPLIWRRRHPGAVLATLSGVALLQWFLTGPLLADVALLAMLFTLALERPLKTAVAGGLVVEFGVVMASARWNLGGSWDRSLVGLTALAGVALLLGAVLRARRAHFAHLTERAARLELERDQQTQLAAAAERTRIAREMHDVIAHSLAVIVTMSEAASAKLTRDPHTASAAITTITEVSRQALADTRSLLGVLRDDPDDTGASERAALAPQPGLIAIDELIHRLRATGLDASIRYQGRPFNLASGVELTIYRLVQEAATNTLKHAKGATRFAVNLTFEHPTVSVDAADDGERLDPERRGQERGGHGLVGMRERAALYHGQVTAGPRRYQGWTVHATLVAAANP